MAEEVYREYIGLRHTTPMTQNQMEYQDEKCTYKWKPLGLSQELVCLPRLFYISRRVDGPLHGSRLVLLEAWKLHCLIEVRVAMDSDPLRPEVPCFIVILVGSQKILQTMLSSWVYSPLKVDRM